jgi:tetratricopeptide (TPR) repeat protein
MKHLHQLLTSKLKNSCIFLGLALSISLALPSCDNNSSPSIKVESKALFHEPITANLVELPNEAIPTWRQYAETKPVLLLFGDDPMLQTTHPDLQADINTLVTSGTITDLRKHGPLAAATYLQPSQTLTAILQQKMFSQVIWATSKSAESGALGHSEVIEALFKIGAVDDYERESFKVTTYGQSGTIHDTPFQIVYHDHLPPVDGPILMHLDLTYFKSLYDNEIKTPFFNTLKSYVDTVRKQTYSCVDVTISYSNLINWVPIDMRFAGEMANQVLANPDLLDKPMPESWQRKARSLYLNVFFQNEERAALFLPLVKENPDQKADTYWELFKTTIKFASYEEAIGYLDQAVTRDNAYAVEYFNLAAKAQQRELLEQEVTLWRKAAAAFPDNPYIKLQEIKARIESKEDPNLLRTDLIKLQQLDWSEFYNASIAEEIERLIQSIKL